VVARFGEPHTFEVYGPDTKHPAYQVVEREPVRDEITPWFFRTELDAMFPLEPLERFDGEERHFLPSAAHAGKGSFTEKYRSPSSPFPGTARTSVSGTIPPSAAFAM
jgi:hypothetical protein